MKEEKIIDILNSNKIFQESEFELIEEEFAGEDGTYWVDMYIDSNESPNVINEKDWVHQSISKSAIEDIIKEAQKEQELWDFWKFKEILEDLETSNEIKLFRIKKRIEELSENKNKYGN